jgi:hypothetical protein
VRDPTFCSTIAFETPRAPAESRLIPIGQVFA